MPGRASVYPCGGPKAFGEVSGGHYNPAVSLAMLLDRRMEPLEMAGYWVAQIVGATLASLTLLVATNTETVASTMTTFGQGVEAREAFLFEMVFTAIFLAVILKVTTSARSATTAFLGIGLTLTMIHLVLIPFTGTSVNPARSLGPAIVGGVWTDQWIYWIAPLVGATLGWGDLQARRRRERRVAPAAIPTLEGRLRPTPPWPSARGAMGTRRARSRLRRTGSRPTTG